MKFLNMKLVAALVASISMLATGPAWSATAPHKKAKSALKHKHIVKHKSRASSRQAAAAVAAVSIPVVAMTVETSNAQPGYTPVTPAANPYLAPSGNPYLAYQQTPAHPPADASPATDNAKAFSPSLPYSLKSLLPSWQEGQSILPTFKKVYPTGEKPLVVVTFKCPTELIGITPIPTKILHEVVNGGMSVVNATNLLSFNLQQVCQ